MLDAGKRKVLAERYAAGETMAKLAVEYGCGEATILASLAGIEARLVSVGRANRTIGAC